MVLWTLTAVLLEYSNIPKYWDRQSLANSVDPDQMLHCGIWSGSTLFALIHLSGSDTSPNSEMDVQILGQVW